MISLRYNIRTIIEVKTCMRTIVSQYSKYLLQLSKKCLIEQFKHLQLQAPSKGTKQKFIDTLLQGQTQLIQARLSIITEQERRQQDKISSSIKKNLKVKLEKIVTADRSRIEDKIMRVHKYIQNELAEKYKSRFDIQMLLEQKQQPSRDILSGIESTVFSQMPLLNRLLNIQNEIRLHPTKIQVEYQRNIGELRDSFVTYRSQDYLQNKQKDMYKKMLPRQMQIKGNCISNIFMLYGVKKQEQFIEDLHDPFEKLLLNSKIGRSSNQHINGIINNLFTRGFYYQAIINSLDFQQLYFLVLSISQVNRMTQLSSFILHTSMLKLVHMVRINNSYFNHPYYKTLLNMEITGISSNSVDLEARNKMYKIQGWIVSSLQQFRIFAETVLLRKDQQLDFLEHVVIYKQLKRQMQRQLLQQCNHQDQIELNQEKLKNMLQDHIFEKKVDIHKVFDSSESQNLNQKILEIALFLDIRNSEELLLTHLTLYKRILYYMMNLEQIQPPTDIFQKIFKDNLLLLQRSISLSGSQTLDSRYINNFIQLIFRFNNYINQVDLQLAFKLVWYHYKNIYKASSSMNAHQGKYFIMLTHLGSRLSKINNKVRQQVLLGQDYLLYLKKYVELLVEDQTQSVDKKVIIDMLKDEVLSLLIPQSS